MKYAILLVDKPPTITEHEGWELEEFQRIVGGFVERIPIASPMGKVDLYVNEEGKYMRELTPNAIASLIFGDILVGNAVLTGWNMRALPEKWIKYLMEPESED